MFHGAFSCCLRGLNTFEWLHSGFEDREVRLLM